MHARILTSQCSLKVLLIVQGHGSFHASERSNVSTLNTPESWEKQARDVLHLNTKTLNMKQYSMMASTDINSQIQEKQQ